MKKKNLICVNKYFSDSQEEYPHTLKLNGRTLRWFNIYFLLTYVYCFYQIKITVDIEEIIRCLQIMSLI